MSKVGALDALAPLRATPSRAGILTDFDGTVSPIVDEPSAARPLDGVAEMLDRLALRYALVAVISGRPVEYLQPFFSPALVLSGLYGLEVIRKGKRLDHPTAGAWREVIDDVATVAKVSGPPGMRVEHKGISITLHFREHPEIEADVIAFATRQAARSGLSARPARMSIELHPPIAADKGTAVRELASGLEALCFIGDDLGDLPGFEALDGLAAEGVATVRVAVRSDEAPAELLDLADVVVDGPEGAHALLASLL
jgi:trehalose 6-phosphate phosphatase